MERKKSDSVAIIGTRDPDEEQSLAAFHLAGMLSLARYMIINTGAAYGIDLQAMRGARDGKLMVYLPWASYNKEIVPAHAFKVTYDSRIDTDWADSVRKYHPAADRLSRGAFALHARNFGIIRDVCGVIALPGPDGGGGTGQGIRIARDLKIPVIIGCKGKIKAAEFMGRALQMLGFADPNLKPTLPGR